MEIRTLDTKEKQQENEKTSLRPGESYNDALESNFDYNIVIRDWMRQVISDKELSQGAQQILIAWMVFCMQSDGRLYPVHPKIYNKDTASGYVNISRAAYYNNVTEAKESGYVMRCGHFIDEDHRGTFDFYELDFPE